MPVRAELLAATRELASRHELGASAAPWKHRRRDYLRALPGAAVARRSARAAAPEARRRRRPARPLAPHRGGEEARALRRSRRAASRRRSCARSHAQRRERLAQTMQRVAVGARQPDPHRRGAIWRGSARATTSPCLDRVIARHRERYAQVGAALPDAEAKPCRPTRSSRAALRSCSIRAAARCARRSRSRPAIRC